MKDFIIPITLYTILREIFRYNMLCKAEGNRLSAIIVVMFFIVLDVSNSIYYGSFNNKIEIIILDTLKYPKS